MFRHTFWEVWPCSEIQPCLRLFSCEVILPNQLFLSTLIIIQMISSLVLFLDKLILQHQLFPMDTFKEIWYVNDFSCAFTESLPEHDPTGRTFYVKVCEKLGVVPVSYFARHITDPEITMRFHGLGPHGTRAIARVLRVSRSACLFSLVVCFTVLSNYVCITLVCYSLSKIYLSISDCNIFDKLFLPHIKRGIFH